MHVYLVVPALRVARYLSNLRRVRRVGLQRSEGEGSVVLLADPALLLYPRHVGGVLGVERGDDLLHVPAQDEVEPLLVRRVGAEDDLLITDSLLPWMNGLELVRSIRSSPDAGLSALPVIMRTSRQGEHDVIEGLKTGLDDHVTKAFSPDELVARVRTVLWRTRQDRR